MGPENPISLFQEFIPQKECHSIRKVSLKFNDVLLLKWISFNNKNVYRRNYLKVSYKNKKVKHISLSLSNKNNLKQNVKIFNLHLKSL